MSLFCFLTNFNLTLDNIDPKYSELHIIFFEFIKTKKRLSLASALVDIATSKFAFLHVIKNFKKFIYSELIILYFFSSFDQGTTSS